MYTYKTWQHSNDSPWAKSEVQQHRGAFIIIVAAYRCPCGGRFGVLVEGEHSSVENRPRLGPVFPERAE